MSGSSNHSRIRSVPQRLPYNYQNLAPRRQMSHQAYQHMHHQYGGPIEHRSLGGTSGSNFHPQRLSSPADSKMKGYFESEMGVFCFKFFNMIFIITF